MLSLLFALLAAFAPAQTQVETEVVAGELGRELDGYLARCEAFGFSGVVLFERAGRPILRKGYGEARPGVPNTPESLYDLASASKQVTAAAILKLAELGRLELDDSISEHLPDVPKQHREVSLRHLLNHTSGWPRYGSSGSGADRQRAMAGYMRAQRSSKAGKRFEYFNGGYAMLAAVVEEVCEEPFEDWVARELFEPAGLVETDFIETARVDPERIAATPDGRKLATDYIKGWGYRGMGGVLTSVLDVSRWMAALNGGVLLSEESLEVLFEPQLGDYACGWYVFETDGGKLVRQHNGGTPDFGSYIRHFVEQDVLIVVLTNRPDMCWQVTWGLSGLALGENPKAPAPPEPLQPEGAALEAVLGRWTGKAGAIELSTAGNSLRLSGVSGDVLGEFVSSGGSGGSRGKVRPAELERASERALSMLEELQAGRVELIAEELAPRIPARWPNDILTRYWPAHLKRHGPVERMQPCGAIFDADSGRLRTWTRLHHAGGVSAVEISFLGSALNILDLKASPQPFARRVAFVSETRLEAFDFGAQPPFVLELRKRGKQLTLTGPSGSTLKFVRAQDGR